MRSSGPKIVKAAVANVYEVPRDGVLNSIERSLCIDKNYVFCSENVLSMGYILKKNPLCRLIILLHANSKGNAFCMSMLDLFSPIKVLSAYSMYVVIDTDVLRSTIVLLFPT